MCRRLVCVCLCARVHVRARVAKKRQTLELWWPSPQKKRRNKSEALIPACRDRRQRDVEVNRLWNRVEPLSSDAIKHKEMKKKASLQRDELALICSQLLPKLLPSFIAYLWNSAISRKFLFANVTGWCLQFATFVLLQCKLAGVTLSIPAGAFSLSVIVKRNWSEARGCDLH